MDRNGVEYLHSKAFPSRPLPSPLYKQSPQPLYSHVQSKHTSATNSGGPSKILRQNFNEEPNPRLELYNNFDPPTFDLEEGLATMPFNNDFLWLDGQMFEPNPKKQFACNKTRHLEPALHVDSKTYVDGSKVASTKAGDPANNYALCINNQSERARGSSSFDKGKEELLNGKERDYLDRFLDTVQLGLIPPPVATGDDAITGPVYMDSPSFNTMARNSKHGGDLNGGNLLDSFSMSTVNSTISSGGNSAGVETICNYSRSCELMKRHKFVGKTLLDPEQKRAHHIASEHKRRNRIRDELTRLTELVPNLSKSQRNSQAKILLEAANYIEKLKAENSKLKHHHSL